MTPEVSLTILKQDLSHRNNAKNCRSYIVTKCNQIFDLLLVINVHENSAYCVFGTKSSFEKETSNCQHILDI